MFLQELMVNQQRLRGLTSPTQGSAQPAPKRRFVCWRADAIKATQPDPHGAIELILAEKLQTLLQALLYCHCPIPKNGRKKTPRAGF